MAQWLTGTVVEKKEWNPTLFSLRVQTQPFTFTAGQFVRLGLQGPEGRIQRAYSLVNSPDQTVLDFMVTLVPDGLFSPMLAALRPGDPIEVSQPPSGFFTLDDIPEADNLWLIATGTGVGPYFSMLGTNTPWQRFQRVVLVHAVRQAADLCYQDNIADWQSTYPDQFRFVPVVSRETAPGALHGRVTGFIESGQLEQAAECSLDSRSQIMICGNPAMIKDTRALLETRDLNLNLKRRPGNVTVEQYWK
ncbi:MAG: ferredoxin--NADP reductase [Idiomarina sp.]|nr:ferredoxin--NADP reductase [Idiomarina sp.]